MFVRLAGLLCVLNCVAMAADSGAEAARTQQEASVGRQRVAVQAQASAIAARNPRFFSTTTVAPEAAPDPGCPGATVGQIREIVDEGARRTGLDPQLVRAVVRKESAYDPCATSPKGAQGLMQLMPATQAQFGVTNAYDPRQNVDAGTRLLKGLLEQYGGDLTRALGAYNAGPARVAQFDGLPPFPETQNYVSTILRDISPK
jgi:soluble lytic murein transglycosylase-like protein